MANSVSHASLPFPIKNARFTVIVPYLDADGDPTDPTTPDSEVSQDGGAFADAAEEVTTISGTNGCGYITLTGAETNNSAVAVAFKVASGPKNTLMSLYPRNLPILSNGTLSAGSAGGGTLGTILAYDVTGCFLRTTGGTGGGGTGGANNQARRIITYTISTGAFTVSPNWETTPSTDTTYDVLLPEGVTSGMVKGNVTQFNGSNVTSASGRPEVNTTHAAGTAWNSGAILDTTFATDSITSTKIKSNAIDKIAAGVWQDIVAADFTVANSVGKSVMNGVALGTGLTVARCTLADTVTTLTNLPAITAGWLTATGIAADAITAAKIADGAIDAATFAAGAINAAAIAADAITDAKVAADVTIASVTGAVGSVTARVTANVDQINATSIAGTGSRVADAFVVFFNVASSVLTTASVNQTGDSFARIGATGSGLTSLASAATAATIAGYIDTEVAAILAAVDTEIGDIQSRLPAALVSGRMDASVGAMAANVITAAATAADFGAEVAAAVWDLAVSGHTTSGTFGAAMNAAGSAGDPWSTTLPGAYGAGTAGFIVGNSSSAATVATAVWDSNLSSGLGGPSIARTLMNNTATALSVPTAAAIATAWGARVLGNGRTADYYLQGGANKTVRTANAFTVYLYDDSTPLMTSVLTESGSLNPIASVDPT